MTIEWTPRRAIDFAMTTEELGERFYHRMANRFPSKPEVAAVFRKLAADEDAHRKQFSELLEAVEKERDDLREFRRKEVLRAEVRQQFFSRSAGPFEKADEIETPADALRHAFAFETAAVDYYESLQDVLGDHQVLRHIVEAEKDHVRALMKVILSDAEFRGTGDSWT